MFMTHSSYAKNRPRANFMAEAFPLKKVIAFA